MNTMAIHERNMKMVPQEVFRIPVTANQVSSYLRTEGMQVTELQARMLAQRCRRMPRYIRNRFPQAWIQTEARAVIEAMQALDCEDTDCT